MKFGNQIQADRLSFGNVTAALTQPQVLAKRRKLSVFDKLKSNNELYRNFFLFKLIKISYDKTIIILPFSVKRYNLFFTFFSAIAYPDDTRMTTDPAIAGV